MKETEAPTEFRRPPSFSPEFEVHSAPEAIRAYIEAARDRQEAIKNELGWLEGLYLCRLAQKEAGTWP